MTRRNFTLAATAASYGRIHGANGRLGVGLVGSGRRGRDVMAGFLQTQRAELAAIADIYDVQRERAVSQLGVKPLVQTAAYEEVLGRREVDAVLIATPDHHHLDQASEALRMGKHVFLEKPCLHKLEEGAALRRAVRMSRGKVLQAGQQQRSGAHYQQAKALVDSGKLGKVLIVRTYWSNFPWQSRKIAGQAQPAGLDWARFIGNAPWADYDWIRYDSWRYFPDYGGGVLADIFTHWADVAQWFLNDAAPLDAVATGGQYIYAEDGRVNPDTVNAIVRYKNWNLTFESSVAPLRDDRPGLTFFGTEGTLEMTRAEYVFRPHKGEAVTMKAVGTLEVAHAANFIDAIEGKATQTADVEVAVQSCLPQLLARAAYWSTKRVRYAAGRNEFFTE